MPFLGRSTLGCLALLLAWGHPLLADQMRSFVNNSSYWWTIQLDPRKIPEMGDMTFTLQGAVVGKLGVSSKTPIRLAPLSSYTVLYDSKGGEFHHMFKITHDAAADPNPLNPKDTKKPPYADDPTQSMPLRFAYDHSALDGLARVVAGRRVQLVPVQVTPNPNNLVLDTPTTKGDVGINLPIPGELVIHPTPNAVLPKTTPIPFVIDAQSGGDGWQFALPSIAEKNTLGTLAVGRSTSALTNLKQGTPVPVPAGGALNFWVTPGADGQFAQAFTLNHPVHGRYQFKITNTTGAYPEDVALAETVALPDKAGKTWVFGDQFILDRSIHIIDPNAEVDWGEGLEQN